MTVLRGTRLTPVSWLFLVVVCGLIAWAWGLLLWAVIARAHGDDSLASVLDAVIGLTALATVIAALRAGWQVWRRGRRHAAHHED